jgi:hypothetical protein
LRRFVRFVGCTSWSFLDGRILCHPGTWKTLLG